MLFFVPFLNLLLFLFLCLVPPRSSDTADRASRLPRESFIYRMVPGSAIGSAAISLLITVPLGLGMALLGAQLLMIYGWGLFVGLPFTMGFAAALIYGVRQPRSIGGCVGVACLSVTLLGAALLGLAIEGVFCLLMAMPIALALAVIGGSFGYLVQRRRWLHEAPAFLSVLLVLAPGIQWIEHAAALTAPVYAVRSSIDIQASPERVWKRVVAFAEIPPPREWMFRAGIAYPIRAEIFGTGPGAERHCVFYRRLCRAHISLGRAATTEILRNLESRTHGRMDPILAHRTSPSVRLPRIEWWSIPADPAAQRRNPAGRHHLVPA